MHLGVLGLGLVEIGEYEEGLELSRRGTELARKSQNALGLWYNLNHLGRAYEALLDLEEARRVHEEALELRGPLGPQESTVNFCSGRWGRSIRTRRRREVLPKLCSHSLPIPRTVLHGGVRWG
jgi:tetratricopeptide (TPR) repeat protein